MLYLPVDPDGRLAVSDGKPVYYSAPLVRAHNRADWAAAAVKPGEVVAVRVEPEDIDSQLEAENTTVGDIREFDDDPVAARALALLFNRERVRFDPYDGSELTYDEEGRIAFGAGRLPIYPRIQPAVIGAVILEREGHEPAILVAQNRTRPGYYSLIAGYLEAGETVEEAFVREVREETGRRLHEITYVASQPWPISGSIMIGLKGTTSDEEPVAQVDGEIFDERWVTAAELDEITWPKQGSIAYRMLESFQKGEL